MRNKLLIILCLVASMMFNTFAITSLAANKDEVTGHEYDNVYVEEEKIETTIIETSKSFSDIKDENLFKYAELLNSIGIINGYGDGTFKPDNSITRGEISAIIIRMLNQDAEVLKSLEGSFYDVDSTHQFYDAISACVNLGIINGYEDNSFRSENTITYNELIAMVVRALGYSEQARVQGGYPSGYLMVANNIGILNGATAKDANAVTRGEAATVIYRALHAPVSNQVSFGEDVTYDSEKSKTVLSENFDIYKSTGVVKANSITTIGNDEAMENSIVIGTKRFIDKDGKFGDYLGYKVDYYYKSDIDSGEIVFMYKNQTVKELIITENTKRNYSNLTYTYEVNEDKTKTASITKIHDLIVNGVRASGYDDSIFDFENGRVKLVSNEGESVYDTVIMETYDNYILKNISGNAEEVKLLLEHGYKTMEIDLSETKFEIVDGNGNKISYLATIAGVFDANGKPAMTTDFSKVEADSVISVYTNKFGPSQRSRRYPAEDADYVKIVVSPRKIEGTVDSWNKTTVTDSGTGKTSTLWEEIIIDGKEYKVSTSNFMNEDDCLCNLGDNGTFYIDSYGKIAAFKKGDATAGEYEYGYLIKAVNAGAIGGKVDMKILTVANEKKVFKCKDGVFINNEKKTGNAILTELSKSAKMIDPKMEMSQVIKYKTNTEGEITHIQTVLQSVGLPAGADSTHLNRYEDRTQYWVEYDTSGRLKKPGESNYAFFFQPEIYFTVPETEEYVDDDTRYKTGGITTYDYTYIDVYDVEYLMPKVAVRYEVSSGEEMIVTLTKSENRTGVMVKKLEKSVDEDGFGTAKITVVNGISESEYYAETADMFVDPETGKEVQPGDMILLYSKGKDIVSSWKYSTFDNKKLTRENIENGVFKPLLETWKKYDSSNGYGKLNTILEPYIILEGSKMVMQGGKVVDTETGRRSNWTTGYMNTNQAWQKGGAIVCDASESKEKPSIRVGSISDFKSVYNDGAENASLVFAFSHHGGAVVYIIYNGYNK